MITQVILRFLFRSPIYWFEELVIATMVWANALGISWVYKEEGHAKIEFLLTYLPNKLQKTIKVITNVGVSAFSIVLIISSYKLFFIQNRSIPVGGFPFTRAYYFALPVLVGAVWMLIISIFFLVELLSKEKVDIDNKKMQEYL
jgi:TRAP-type C4-dicarboxylate transport system permease small subunit